MNIGIDARLYGLEHAGIGRYVMNLVNRLLISDLPVHWTLFCTRDHAEEFSKAKNTTVIPSAIRHYSLYEQTTFLSVLNAANVDLLHVPHFNVPLGYRRPFVVTIHDILWHQVRGGSVTTLPPALYYVKYLGYRLTVRHAVSQAREVIVPSNFVKSDLITTFPRLNPDKITVTYEGVDKLEKTTIPHTPASPAGRPYPNPYILYVGSAYPHKNLSVVFRALKLLSNTKHKNLQLVIVGSRSVFLNQVRQQVANMGLTPAVRFVGYKSDGEVLTLMHHALCLVHPSKSEGFGLTGLEAMQAETPVVAARATALPEIYGDAALFFNPEDELGLVHHLETLEANPSVRNQLIKAGRSRVKEFSWDKMVEQTIAIYRRILLI